MSDYLTVGLTHEEAELILKLLTDSGATTDSYTTAGILRLKIEQILNPPPQYINAG